MKVELDPASTTDETLTFHVHITEVPLGTAASECKERLYFVQKKNSERDSLRPRTTPQLIRQASGLAITFQFDRPSSVQQVYDAVLELCDGTDQLVYRGGPVELIPLQRLEIRPQKRTDAAQTLWLDIPSSTNDPAQSLKAKILDGADNIPELQKGKAISFELREGSYRAEVSVACSSQEIKLPILRLLAKDEENRQYVLKGPGGTRICAEQSWVQVTLDWIIKTPLLWLVGAPVLLSLAVCAIVYRHKIRDWVRRDKTSKPVSSQSSSATPPPLNEGAGLPPDSLPRTWKSILEEVLKSQLASLHSNLQDVSELLIQVRRHQTQPPTGTTAPVAAYGPVETVGQRESSSSFEPIQAQPGATLTELVSRWWAKGAARDRLDASILRNSFIKPYRSSNIQDSMRSSTNRTFIFQPAEGQAEWLGRPQQGELFLVPGDPKLFQTGDSLKFLGVLFEGLGSSLSNVRFRRVIKACRLRKEPGSADRRMRLGRARAPRVRGRTGGRDLHQPEPELTRTQQAVPVAQPNLSRKELADVVREAVGGGKLSSLPGQIEALLQQVRGASQGSARRGSEAPRTDTDVTATLGAVRQDLAALGQR